jgi:hypothetical protein
MAHNFTNFVQKLQTVMKNNEHQQDCTTRSADVTDPVNMANARCITDRQLTEKLRSYYGSVHE